MRRRYFLFGLGAVIALFVVTGSGSGSPAEASRVPIAASGPAPACSGPWNLVPSPNVSSRDNYLQSAAAVTANDVWAVGFASTASDSQTLIEHWNGTGWAIVPSANGTSAYNGLQGVAVVAANDVWAVGYTATATNSQTLIEHWDGFTWTVVPSPNPSTTSNLLRSVAVVGTHDVWAVGAYDSGGSTQTLTEHWDGTTWTAVPSPNPGTNTTGLQSVAVVAAGDVWAVGAYYNSSSSQTLIEHWNGTTWTVVPSPSPGIYYNTLQGVAVVAVHDVWAVGLYADAKGDPNRTLTAHWDGTSWAVVPSPNPGASNNSLWSVAGVAPDDVWASGYSYNGSSSPTLIAHWDGSSWAAVPSPNGSTYHNTLTSLAAVSANDLWVVGYFDTGSAIQTMIAHYTCVPPSPTPTAPPSPTNTPPSTATLAGPTATATPTVAAGPTQTPGGPTATTTPTVAAGPTQTPTGPSATPIPSRTPGAPAPIVDSPGSQEAPRVDHHLLVYEDNASGDWDLFAKDLSQSGSIVFPVYRGPGDQRAPAISGDLVVWQDNRNGNWDIYGVHLTGGAAFPISVGPGDQTHPRVFGSLVVWENSLGGGPTSIMAEDLANGQPFLLSDANTTNLAPDINGTLIVWQSTTLAPVRPGASAAGWQITGYDLRTGRASLLSSGPGDHTAPSVSNNSVVWVTTLPAGGAGPSTIRGSSIDGVDIGGGRGTPTPIAIAPASPGHQVSQPRVKGHQVTFVDETAETRGVIVGTSLDTPSAVTLLSARGRDARDPDIDDGGNVVWRQGSGTGETHIYGTGCQATAYTDVQVTDYFFAPVQWLTCIGALGGYADGSFRPYANTTRGQLAKVSGAAGWAITTTGGPHFSDVSTSNPFYPFIETAFNHGVISGYADGTFRWGANVTRGQLSKIIVGAQNWTIATTGGPHFGDVPAGNPFYPFVETAYNHGIISGYADGTFRVGANATRGQISKIVYIALTTP